VLKPVDLLPFSGPLSAILPVCSALDNSSLVVQFFLKGAVSLPEGSASFSRVGLGEYHMSLVLTYLVYGMSHKQVYSQWQQLQQWWWQPTSFQGVNWHGEAFHRLRVQHVKGCFIFIC
jgi:hypothetical protein